jgi:dicarboxylate/amino acid:cation (Na+ or H+) symporter, DAACS family
MAETSGVAKAGPGGQHWAILIGLAVGVLGGLAARQFLPAEQIEFWATRVARPLGSIFLRLVMMVVIPLILSALVLGVYEIGDVRKLGRMGLKTFGVTCLFSAMAVLIGVTLVNAIGPGRGLDPGKTKLLQEKFGANAAKFEDQQKKNAQAKPLETMLLDIIPNNLLAEMVGAIDGSSPGNGMLAVMFFAVAFGIAMTAVGAEAEPLAAVLRATMACTMAIIGFAMRIAPLAVACLMFAATATLGADILKLLAAFVGTVVGGLTLHMAVVYSLAILLFARRSPLWFFAKTSKALLTAFATSSSNATLPVSLRVAEEDLKLPPELARFVLTVGATANQNGTALFEGVVVLFLCQVFGIDLTLMQQVTVVMMSVLAGVGTAGVPGGSIPLIVGVLNGVGAPPGAIGVVLGVDRLLDMCRTAVNVVGDLAVAVCVAGPVRGDGTAGPSA